MHKIRLCNVRHKYIYCHDTKFNLLMVSYVPNRLSILLWYHWRLNVMAFFVCVDIRSCRRSGWLKLFH